MKDPSGHHVVKELIKKADIIIEPHRPGVLEKLQLGPSDLFKINPRVILLRITGYGQTGPDSMRPGHDLNYISTSGIVPLINKPGEFQFPANFLADFVSVSLGITGVLGALALREKSQEGGVVDCSLAGGCTYFAQAMIQTRNEGA